MLTDFIHRYAGVFSKEECAEIIQHIDFFEQNNILFRDRESLHKEDQSSINATHSYDLDIPAMSRIAGTIIPKFQPCVDDYLQTYSTLGRKKFLVYDCKLKKLPAGSGFHMWHFENGSMLSAQRQFVIQLYVNDDFNGGETEFLYQNKRETPKAGDVLIFPCSFTHTHRGNPPIGGTKYLVTSWGWVQDSGSDY
tara:strand:+ start:1204 stop:1785 length:582 start_codon:yes stop_codon:yes gene_type:complete